MIIMSLYISMSSSWCSTELMTNLNICIWIGTMPCCQCQDGWWSSCVSSGQARSGWIDLWQFRMMSQGDWGDTSACNSSDRKWKAQEQPANSEVSKDLHIGSFNRHCMTPPRIHHQRRPVAREDDVSCDCQRVMSGTTAWIGKEQSVYITPDDPFHGDEDGCYSINLMYLDPLKQTCWWTSIMRHDAVMK